MSDLWDHSEDIGVKDTSTKEGKVVRRCPFLHALQRDYNRERRRHELGDAACMLVNVVIIY